MLADREQEAYDNWLNPLREAAEITVNERSAEYYSSGENFQYEAGGDEYRGKYGYYGYRTTKTRYNKYRDD